MQFGLLNIILYSGVNHLRKVSCLNLRRTLLPIFVYPPVWKKQCVVSSGVHPRGIILGSIKEKVGSSIAKEWGMEEAGWGWGGGTQKQWEEGEETMKTRRQSYKFWTPSSKASSLTFPDLGQISWKWVKIKPEGSFIHQSFVTPVFLLLEREEKINYAQPHVCKMPLVHYR